MSISGHAASARENARQSDGRFGEQGHGDPGQIGLVVGYRQTPFTREVKVTSGPNGLASDIEPWFGDHLDDFDVPAICEEIRAQLRGRLEPDGLYLSWPDNSSAYVTTDNADMDSGESARLFHDAFEAIDLEAISRRHDRTEVRSPAAAPDGR